MEKKIALVTGANRGIGYETAKMLAEKGFSVILTSRDEKKGADAIARLSNKFPSVYYHPLDVTDIQSIHHLKDYLKKEFGVLDILVNNAGIISSTKGITETSIDEFRKVMETNYFGVIATIQSMTPLLKKSKDARIINISSGMGASDSLMGNYAAYRLSKAALNDVTQLLANELSGDGIKVNAVCPGWVKSDMGGVNAPRSLTEGADTIVWLATRNTIPTGKFFRDRKEIDW